MHNMLHETYKHSQSQEDIYQSNLKSYLYAYECLVNCKIIKNTSQCYIGDNVR